MQELAEPIQPKKRGRPKGAKGKKGLPPSPEEHEKALARANEELGLQRILIDEELTVAATSAKLIANNLILINRAQTQCLAMMPYASSAEASVICERLARINSELGTGFKNPMTFSPAIMNVINQIKVTVGNTQ